MTIQLKKVHPDINDIKAFLFGFIKGGAVLYLFYRSFAIVLILAFIYGIYSIPLERKKRKSEWRWRINLEFKDLSQVFVSVISCCAASFISALLPFE